MAALIWEIVYMSVMVVLIGYFLHYFAYRKGLGDHKGEVVRPKKSDEQGKEMLKQAATNPFLKKWMDFGGGYYGIVAFVKLVLIELNQLKNFVADWDGSRQFSDLLSINTLISFFIEQIQNFVAAIIWPTDYLREYSILQCAIFVAVTYAFYEGSKIMARNRLKTNNGRRFSATN